MIEHSWFYPPLLPEDGHFVWLCPKGRPVCEAIFCNSMRHSNFGGNDPVFIEAVDSAGETIYRLEDIECWMPYFTPEPPK